jgi:hypothetical protein
MYYFAKHNLDLGMKFLFSDDPKCRYITFNARRVSRGKPFWTCDILGLQKVKERGGVADFVAFGCTSQEKSGLWLGGVVLGTL